MALTTILKSNNEAQIQVIAAKLRASGIETTIYQESAGSAIGINIGVLGEISLLADEADVQIALSIMDTVSIDEPIVGNEPNEE
jgi:Putative prokaryotic signal transducing protein